MRKSAPYEKAEQKAIVKWLENRGFFVFHIPNHKEMHKDPGAMSGIPDLQIVLPEGKVIWMELKRREGGRLSPVQKEVHKRLEELGHIVIVGYGAKDAMEKFKETLASL